MKKAAFTLLFLLTSLSVQAVLVDDFESYATGPISQVTDGKWVPAFSAGTDPGADSAVRSITVDPTDAQNQALCIETTNAGQYSMYGVLPAACVITDGTTKTFHTKFYATGTGVDQSIGLTSADAPTTFSNFLTQFALVRGNVLVRNGGGSTTVGTFTGSTWYYLWIVVNNQANTYSVYLKNTASAATSADRIAENFAFRTPGTSNPDGDLDRFLTVVNYGPDNTAGTKVYFDNMTVSDGEDLSVYVHGAATNPSPAAGAENVPLTATLSWNTGADPLNPSQPNPAITHHYVYFRETDPNFTSADLSTIAASGATGAYDPGLLTVNKRYYWRVDEGVNNLPVTDPNTITGQLWYFDVIREAPVIHSQPADLAVFPGDPATFSFTASSFMPADYTWYASDDEAVDSGDTVLTTGSLPAQTVHAIELPLTDVQLADQKYYYCKVASASGTVYTDVVSLTVNRLLAWYEFEGTLADGVGANNGTGLNADPNFTSQVPTFTDGAKADTQALLLNAAAEGNSQYVDLGTGAYPKAGLGNGMDAGTISCWIKPTENGAILCNINDNQTVNDESVGTTGFIFSQPNATQDRMMVRGQGLEGEYQEIGTVQGGTVDMVTGGAWHHVVTTWKAGDHVRVYVDGLQTAQVTGGTPDQYLPWTRGVLIGASRTAADRGVLADFFNGAIDDLRVYNYPQTADDIATLYFETSNKGVCTRPYASESDFNGDCKVNLGDFAEMASAWLDCGLYPQAACVE